MVDFLKANPFVTMDGYKWGLSSPMVKLMCADNTRIHYLSEKQAEMRKAKRFDGTNTEMLNDLGIPVFGALDKNNND